MAPSPPTRLAAAAAERGFAALSRLRGTRAVHPKGPVLGAQVTLAGGLADVPALAGPRTLEALVRPSMAFGLPDGYRDLHGLTVRLCDLHAPGRHQDLLLASSAAPPLHLLLAPTGDPEHAWFTSLLPYRVGGRRTILVAHGLGGGRYALGLCGPGRRAVQWFAEVDAGAPLEPDPGEGVSFDPFVNAVPELIQDAGPLDFVRARAYVGSRAGRDAPPAG
jgi:hypothetical protein